MADLPRRYRYKYTLELSCGVWVHTYLVIGRWGALHFHVRDFNPDAVDPDKRYGAGLEAHYRQPPESMCDQPPDHDQCWAIKAPCWHDGTSLYAHETLLPYWLNCMADADHQRMFEWLAGEARERFEEFTEGGAS